MGTAKHMAPNTGQMKLATANPSPALMARVDPALHTGPCRRQEADFVVARGRGAPGAAEEVIGYMSDSGAARKPESKLRGCGRNHSCALGKEGCLATGLTAGAELEGSLWSGGLKASWLAPEAAREVGPALQDLGFAPLHPQHPRGQCPCQVTLPTPLEVLSSALWFQGNTSGPNLYPELQPPSPFLKWTQPHSAPAIRLTRPPCSGPTHPFTSTFDLFVIL